MLGRKSIVTEIVIVNQLNPSVPHVVKVQANKNHGICDIIVGRKVPQEIIDEKTKKKRTITKFFPICRAGDVFSTFQGRQYDDPDVFEALEDALYSSLNF